MLFKIVVVSLTLVGNVVQGAPEVRTSVTVFDNQKQCEAAREALVAELVADLDSVLRESGPPGAYTQAESSCAGIPTSGSLSDRGADQLAQTLRDMIRGGGFGTIRQ